MRLGITRRDRGKDTGVFRVFGQTDRNGNSKTKNDRLTQERNVGGIATNIARQQSCS